MSHGLRQAQVMEFAEAFDVYDTEDSQSIPLKHVPLVLRTVGATIPEARLAALIARKSAEVGVFDSSAGPAGDAASAATAGSPVPASRGASPADGGADGQQQQGRGINGIRVTFEDFLALFSDDACTAAEAEAAEKERRCADLIAAIGLYDVGQTGFISAADARRIFADTVSEAELDGLAAMADPRATGRLDIEKLARAVVGV